MVLKKIIDQLHHNVSIAYGVSMFIQGAGLFFCIGIFPQLASDNIGI
jgi:hypothetical protein